MNTLSLDKISSATARLAIPAHTHITDAITPRAGHVIAVRALDRKQTYNKLEDCHGRLRTIYPGDTIAGVLGTRQALHGYGGIVPPNITVGDTLHVLNLGGVIGQCTTSNPAVGPALRVEVLGAVLHPTAQLPAHLGMNALSPVSTLGPTPPIIFVSGTCMNAGKTLVACELVQGLTQHGLSVAAAKLTGVATKRDLLAMSDCGATNSLSFCDAGFPSTNKTNAPLAARAVLSELASQSPDVIVAELGDGLLGNYGVLEILQQPDIAARPSVHVCCASDPVGAYGAVRIFHDTLGILPHVISGPATDNAVGRETIQEKLHTPAHNARDNAPALVHTIHLAIQHTLSVPSWHQQTLAFA